MTMAELWRPAWTGPLFNHLWQSSLVLLVAWLLAISLRRNAARVRYAIWMVASMKFLVPFSLLADLGARWVRPIGGKSVGSAVYTTVVEVGQPFPQSTAPAVHPAAVAQPFQWLAILPVVLAGIWICGFAVVLARWCVRWRQMARLAADCVPVDAGREVDALRRAERNAGLRNAIPVRASSRAIEPGVFGLFHPVLLWPDGISAHLEDAQVDSIMAHEAEHVRRRDNLTAAIHMLVEALFWFHPAVRWTGFRLTEERERACDEKVVEMNARPESYAESILKVCAFCLEPPAPCVAGVSGSDLKTRVLRIMTHRSGAGLSVVRKLALAVIALSAIAVPLGFGVLHALQAPTPLVHPASGPTPSFDVVSIKPSPETVQNLRRIGMSPTGFTGEHVTLKEIIGVAYDLRGDGQLVGGPSWMNSERFDVDAKESEADIKAAEQLSMDQRRTQLSRMLQSMLADRFGFKASIETRELPVYALVVGKGGAKLKEVQADPFPPPGTPPPPGAHLPRLMTHDGREFTATAFRIGEFTHWLSRFEELDNRIVVDETGLKGNYDFVLSGISMGSDMDQNHDASQAPPISIFTALQEQLGLKLEERKAPVEVLVVEHAERPSPN